MHLSRLVMVCNDFRPATLYDNMRTVFDDADDDSDDGGDGGGCDGGGCDDGDDDDTFWFGEVLAFIVE
jgi:hypothetical protein